MTNILDLPDDVLFLCLQCLPPLDFVCVSVTCTHFTNTLTAAKKYSQSQVNVNNYWKYQCEKQWDKINHKCKTDYPCITQPYYTLFKSMIDFILQTLLGEQMIRKAIAMKDSLRSDHDKVITASMKNVQRLRKDTWNMETTMNKLCKQSNKNTNLLKDIIKFDNIDLFKIYVCNMSDDDITLKFNPKADKERIWVNIIQNESNKIAKFILTPPCSGMNPMMTMAMII